MIDEDNCITIQGGMLEDNLAQLGSIKIDVIKNSDGIWEATAPIERKSENGR